MRSPSLHLLCYLPLTVHATTVVQNATYDDIQILSGEIPLGTYDNLVYNLVNVTRARPSGSAGSAGSGVTTASSPNCALTAALQSSTGGVTSFAVAAPYKSLELLDFDFGCVLHSAQEYNAADAASTMCTITVTGFLRDTYAEISPVTYTFSPPEGLMMPVPMNHAVLPARFQQPLFNVTLTQNNRLAVLLLDNLRYSVST